ncbi:conserved hypothetical protein [Azorhizobium caulinodans ORS 571]|uniref:2Fe-2S ferredoxin-type domain-containing protein n=2 Tax=Azorhizobium caulinodans TaxID=7 RepID=A8I0P6_AZOC5|nr:conserved hypothetical protein [Azorhizobium caulinodans ORS 571]
MDAVKAALHQLGVPNSQVKTEGFGTDRRDPSKKAQKLGKVIATVSFRESHLSAAAREGMTLLDVADESGVFIDSACRSGTCGVKLTSGKVRLGTDDALSDEERAQGYILACQAQPDGDVALDV